MRAMPNYSPVWRMADERTGGYLAAIISDLRDEGASYADVAEHLSHAHGIEVTRQTIANWIKAGRTEQVTA